LAKSNLKLVTPTDVNRTVAPTRRSNAELRTREHLTPSEVEAVIEAAKGNRHGHRDATMILLTFRHGLRAAEVCDLHWDQVDCGAPCLRVSAVNSLFSPASSTIATGRPFAIPASLRQGCENINGLSFRTLGRAARVVRASVLLRMADKALPRGATLYDLRRRQNPRRAADFEHEDDHTGNQPQRREGWLLGHCAQA
jgi:integrase